MSLYISKLTIQNLFGVLLILKSFPKTSCYRRKKGLSGIMFNTGHANIHFYSALGVWNSYGKYTPKLWKIGDKTYRADINDDIESFIESLDNIRCNERVLNMYGPRICMEYVSKFFNELCISFVLKQKMNYAAHADYLRTWKVIF